jgi:glycosyltransferase involved in cell wall biosynthesis
MTLKPPLDNGQTSPGAETWVVTATFNERENLPTLLEGLLAVQPPLRVCVVDDGSPDGTGEVADQWAQRHPERVLVIHRAGKLGYASAHREGMRAVLDRRANIVVTMDADLSHQPERIAPMLAALRDADVVVGSRYVPGGRTENWSAFRIFLSRFGGGVVTRWLTGLRQADCTSGFRAYRREILERANPWSTRAEGYGFLVELLFRCQRLGARIVEVPIVFVDRRAGRSKLSKRIIVESALLCFRLFGERWGRAPDTYA